VEAWRWREGVLLATALVFSLAYATGGMLLLAILAIGELFAGEPLWVRTPVDIPLAGLILVAFLSAFGSQWRDIALPSAILLAFSAIVVLRAVVLAVRHRPSFVPRLLAAWAGGAVVAGLFALGTLHGTADARAQLPHLGPNAFGTILAIGVVLLTGLSLADSRRQRVLVVAALPLVAAGLILTWSRGAWLAAVMGFLVLIAATAAPRLGVRLLVLAGGIALVVALVAPQWAFHSGRIRESLDTQNRQSRPFIWQVVPRMVADHPILGTGLASFPHIYARYVPTDPENDPPFAHNILLNFAVETGLLGVAALVGFLGAGLVALIRWHSRQAGEARIISATTLAMLGALLAHQLVDGTLMGVHLTFALFALFGLGIAGDAQAQRAS
jgi:hypothetical protein